MVTMLLTPMSLVSRSSPAGHPLVEEAQPVQQYNGLQIGLIYIDLTGGRLLDHPQPHSLLYAGLRPVRHVLNLMVHNHIFVLLFLMVGLRDRFRLPVQRHGGRIFARPDHGAGIGSAGAPLQMGAVGEGFPVPTPLKAHLLGNGGRLAEKGQVVKLVALDVLAEIKGQTGLDAVKAGHLGLAGAVVVAVHLVLLVPYRAGYQHRQPRLLAQLLP